MKRTIISLLILLVSAFSVCAADSKYTFNEKLFDGKSLCDFCQIEDIPVINGHSAYVYNVETGSVIFRKNQDDPVYPASTVKLMTAIVAY